ncbi:MAG: hypothetical protein FWD34_02660 [Oscillospiraceae bacterium]|nr:hypothetical protein [Oscillospiraceae bacterium]
MENKFCTQCSTQVAGDLMFCTECGAALPEAFEPVEVVEEAVEVIEEPIEIIEEAVPVVEEPVAVVEEPIEIIEEAVPVIEEAVPVIEEAVPVIEEPVAVVEEPVAEQPVAVAAAEPIIITQTETIKETVIIEKEVPAPVEQKPEPVPVVEEPVVAAEPPQAANQPVAAATVFAEPETFSQTPPTVEQSAAGEIIINNIVAEAPEVQGAKKVKPPQSIGKKILIALVSVLLSLILISGVTVLQVSVIMRMVVNNPSTIQAMVDGIDFTDMKLPLPIPDVDLGGGEILSEAIFMVIDDYYIETFDISKENIEDLLQSDLINEYIGELLYDNINYLLTGQGDGQIIDARELVKFIENNTDEIEDITGYRIKTEDLDDIQDVLRDTLKELTWDDIIDDVPMPIDLSGVRRIFSPVTLIVIISVVVVLMAVIVIIHRRKSTALIYCGISCILSGLSVVIAGAMSSSVYAIINSSLSGLIELDESFIGGILTGMNNTILATGAITVGGGVLIMVVAIVSRSIKNSIDKKVAAV